MHVTKRQRLVEEAWERCGLRVHQAIIWVKAHGYGAPKPERKRTARKLTTANGDAIPTDANGHAHAIVEQTHGKYECGECSAVFDTQDEAAAHISEVHPA